MRCKVVRKKLTAYLDNELTDRSEGEIERHISICGNCQALRKELILPHFYLPRLRDEPVRTFVPDMTEILPAPELLFLHGTLRPALTTAAFALIIMMFGFLLFRGLNAVRLDLSMPKEGREVAFNTSRPTLVRLGERSWLTIDGEALLCRGREIIRADLLRGALCLAIDDSLKVPVVVNAAGFEVTNLHTEFFVQLLDNKVNVELLSGKVLVKYGEQWDRKAIQLLAKQGASGERSNVGRHSLSIYDLSEYEIAELEKRLGLIKELTQTNRANPKQTRFEAKDVRIEFWKGNE